MEPAPQGHLRMGSPPRSRSSKSLDGPTKLCANGTHHSKTSTLSNNKRGKMVRLRWHPAAASSCRCRRRHRRTSRSRGLRNNLAERTSLLPRVGSHRRRPRRSHRTTTYSCRAGSPSRLNPVAALRARPRRRSSRPQRAPSGRAHRAMQLRFARRQLQDLCSQVCSKPGR